MSLIAIGKEVAEICEIECAWNEIDDEYQNDDKYYQEDEENEEDVKYNKIEENIWHQGLTKMTQFHKYSFFALLGFLLSLLVAIWALFYMEESVRNSNRYIKELDELMSMPQGTESQYALNFYLMSKISSGTLPKDSCKYYTEDFQKDLLKSTKEIAESRINKYFKYDIETDVVSIDSMNPALFQILGIDFSVQLSESYIDYSNYMTALAVRAERYLTEDLSQLKGSSLTEFVEFMQNHGEGDETSFSKRFIEAVIKNSMKYLNRAESGFQMSLILGAIGIVLFLIVSSYFMFCLFLEILRVISLLFKVPEQKYLQRTHEVKFIVSEIQKLSEYNFKMCKFPSKNKVTITSVTLQEDNSNDFTIEEFEKITEQDVSEDIETVGEIEGMKNTKDIKNTEQERSFLSKRERILNDYLEVILGNKAFFIIVLCIYIYFITTFLIVGTEYNHVFKNNQKMSKVLREGGLTQQTILIQHLAAWMMAFNDTEYFTMEKIKYNFDLVSNYLERQEFFVYLYETMSTEILEETIYQTFCDFFDKIGLLEKETCNTGSGVDYEYFRMPNFIGMIFLSQERIFNYLENGIEKEEIIDTLCQNYMTANYVINPGIRSSWKILRTMINKHRLFTAEMITLVNRVIFTAFFFLLFYLLYYVVRKSIEMKFEVLTMDTPKDLYESANFRPDLNHMYFSHL